MSKNLIKRTDYVIDRRKAKRLIDKVDEKEAKWRRALHNDTWYDPSEFDLLIKPGLVSTLEAWDIIHAALEQPPHRKFLGNLVR